ncbi:hypothetical protein A7P53_10940 [Acinetobacter defluvii]|uniref:hypothetical protein n=1 Tax=Acinetobacter defluvii TaxID=1871111 RepID=UPI00149058A3|nr:hypothetical protein [Acinetobacter defluvii]NNP73083.1 hypothetical protein [Acinetobacter defluvii]
MQNLVFPSGLSVQRAKKRAKELVKTKQACNQIDALDSISLKEINKPWALAIPYLQQNIDYLITLEDIERVMLQEPLLNYNGFGHLDSYSEHFYKKFTFKNTKDEYIQSFIKDRESLKNALDECQRCCLYLQHLKKINVNRYRIGSYGTKHSVEKYQRALNRFDDTYVSNGAFICAAIHMGFKVIRKSDHSPNAWILASVQSDIVIWERLTEKGNWMTSLELKKLQRVTRAIGLS